MGREVLERVAQIPAFSPLGWEGLQQIAHQGRVTRVAAGDYCFRVGEPAHWVSVLLDGQIQITQMQDGEEQVVYTYAAPDFFGDVPVILGMDTYFANARALTDCKVYLIPVDDFWRIFQAYPEATRLFMQEAATRMNRLQTAAAQRGRQSAVSTLAAGLAHELNNPASAALSATGRMAEAIVAVQRTSADLARYLPEPVFNELMDLMRGWLWEGDLPVLTPLTRADREDEVAAWLDARGVEDAWTLSEPAVAAGVEISDLEQLEGLVPPECFASSVRWLAASAQAAGYVCTANRSAGRITQLVETMRGYAYLDQNPVQEIDLNHSLEGTLAVLNYELSGLEVVREYDPELPSVTGYGPELNGVWTTLIENALQALDGRGTLRLTTRREHERVLVEVADTGPGIPPEIQARVFDPFFTTKAVGEGSGLGLSLAYRTVVERHRGDIRFTSRPGQTCFQVRLPVHPSQPLDARRAEAAL